MKRKSAKMSAALAKDLQNNEKLNDDGLKKIDRMMTKIIIICTILILIPAHIFLMSEQF